MNYILAAQAAGSSNPLAIHNIGHVADNDEIETKHQPGSMVQAGLAQQAHASQGGHGQPAHALQPHQQVRDGSRHSTLPLICNVKMRIWNKIP